MERFCFNSDGDPGQRKFFRLYLVSGDRGDWSVELHPPILQRIFRIFIPFPKADKNHLAKGGIRSFIERVLFC